MKVCASCAQVQDINSISFASTLPEWLAEVNFVKNFINSSSPVPSQATSHILYTLELHPSMKNRLLLLWATKPTTSLEIKGAKTAYANFKNHQVARTDINGKIQVRLDTPQLYYVIENGIKKIYPRHFHFVIRDKNHWNQQVYTHVVTPEIDRSFVMQKIRDKTALIINSLPEKLYQQTRIHKNVLNVPVDKINPRNQHIWERRILLSVQKNLPKLSQLISSKKIDVKHVPIIIYCKNDQCRSSTNLINKLLTFGYYNLFHYKGGYEDYNR